MSLDRIERLVLERVLGAEISKKYLTGDIPNASLEPFIPEIRLLSEAYNFPERSRETQLHTERALEAYMLYFLPINYVKLAYLMEKIADKNAPLKVLDFGCGPGTGALTATVKFKCPIISVFDISSKAEETAVELLKKLDPRIKVERPGKNWVDEKYDLIISANSLNEIPESEREVLTRMFIRSLNDEGHLLILEPALKIKTRASMKLRDYILSKNAYMTPIFPCTRKDNCPMLSDYPDDWCHGSLTWEGTRIVRQIDKITGFNKHRLKYSAFIFKKKGELLPGYRMVSIPKKSKIGNSAYLCGKDFYELVNVSKRERSEKSRLFEKSDLWHYLPEFPK